MRCRYRENIYKCGEYLEVDIFPVFHRGSSRRRKRYKPTSEMQARLNQRNAERMLIRLLNENFSKGDLEVTLTYSNANLPDSKEQAERDAKNYIRRVKRLRSKAKLEEMRYVVIPGGGRTHFHIIMTGGIDREKLEAIWGKGYANTKRLAPDGDGLAGLACYIARQYEVDAYDGNDLFSGYEIDAETGEVTERDGSVRRKGKKRFWASKNLIRPEAETRDGRISQARIEELATIDSFSREAWESIYPGYSFSRCEPQYNQENGGWYIHVRLRREEQRRAKKSPRQIT